MTSSRADFCVAVEGPNLDVLLPVFFESFAKVVGTSRLDCHLILKDLSLRDLKIFQDPAPPGTEIITQWSVHTYPCTRGRTVAEDTATTADWMVGSCGTNPYVFLSHFDLWFKEDIVSTMLNLMDKDVGQIGTHCPLMLLNREAYKRCCMRFESFDNFYACPTSDGTNRVKLRHRDDPRRHGGNRVDGFDVGELLELNLQALDYLFFPLKAEIERSTVHFHAGSGYRDERHNQGIRWDAAEALKEIRG